MILPAVVVEVVVQGQGSNGYKEDATNKVVDDLEERLVSSSGTPKVGDEKRQSNENEATNSDQSDVVAILECSTHQLSTEIKRVDSDEDDGCYRENLLQILPTTY